MRNTDATTGATRLGKTGAPVVDLTALVSRLYTSAENCREDAIALLQVVADLRDLADGLDELAGVLSGDTA